MISSQPIDSLASASGLAAAARTAGLHISDQDARRLAMSFPLPISGIDRGVSLAVLEGATELEPDLQASALAVALRRVASPDLPRFARAVEPTFPLDAVVLPEDRQRQLREMVSHVRHAYQVLHTWGFLEQLPYGRGVTALFSGPSGTGKTMAAQAIADELGTRAYRVDLSRVVSKYIGETEKHLDACSTTPNAAGAVLLFDEADALFGKRSEIKDSHDRYANIEVAICCSGWRRFAASRSSRQTCGATSTRRSCAGCASSSSSRSRTRRHARRSGGLPAAGRTAGRGRQPPPAGATPRTDRRQHPADHHPRGVRGRGRRGRRNRDAACDRGGARRAVETGHERRRTGSRGSRDRNDVSGCVGAGRLRLP